MEILNNLIGGGTDFFKFLGFAIFVCFMIYLVCKTVSFNYKFVEGMVNAEKGNEVANILKDGGDGGRVGLDHDKIMGRLEKNRELLNKLLQLPQDTGKIREQLDEFKENIVLEELLLLNEASCRDCAKNKLVTVGHQLKAYKNIGDAINRIHLDKSNGWL
jgi:hypothetical protein